LDYIAGIPNKIDEIQKMVSSLLPENDMYVNDARTLISILVLCVGLDKSKKNTFGEIYRILLSGKLDSYLKSIVTSFSDELGYFGLLNINSFLEKTKENRALVQSLASSALELGRSTN
jgi:type IV secretory pathway TraG/TraD family ATPase VirD4